MVDLGVGVSAFVAVVLREPPAPRGLGRRALAGVALGIWSVAWLFGEAAAALLPSEHI